MKSPLLRKLLGIVALAIGLAMLIVWLAIDFFAADYFSFLMEKYNVPKEEVQQIFLDAAHRYLFWSGLAALALALTLATVLIQMVLRPLRQMIVATTKIAQGNYAARVQSPSQDDEVGQLASAFNRMTDSLQRIEQLRKTMVVDIAHELRIPLTNMRGYLEGLSEGVVAPSRATFASLHEEALRLAALADDLLQLSHADAARSTLRPRRIDLRELLDHALEQFRPGLAERGITAETQLGGPSIEINADAEKVAQVIANLLQNARQYTPRGGRVRVIAEPAPGWLRVTVANTGEPIPTEELPLIFERFYRVDKSRSRGHGGAGIGLAIVKELIEAHGGRVGAESAAGENRVWFALPV